MTLASAWTSARPVALLSTLTESELTFPDSRYPKWATLCQLRRMGMPVLDAVLVTPDQDRQVLDVAIRSLAAATGQNRLLVRSDGGAEARSYYKGGNTFPLQEVASKVSGLLEAGRAVILMEPTNRFTNRLTAVLRMDRYSHGREGAFTIEALRPGYDVADLTRGGIPAQITVTAEVDWSVYSIPWWSDLRMTMNGGSDAEHDRRRQRLTRIATDILTDTGQLAGTPVTSTEQVVVAEGWLRERGYDQLWWTYDIRTAVARRIRGWIDDSFMIAACHPCRDWTCLATATSDLGDRAIFWDIVDGSHKYVARKLI
jgi:hypothetical protein